MQHARYSLDALRCKIRIGQIKWRDFAKMLLYVKGDFTDPGTEGYADLKKKIAQIQQERSIPDNVLFHLSTPPRYYDQIVTSLGKAGLLTRWMGGLRTKANPAPHSGE